MSMMECSDFLRSNLLNQTLPCITWRTIQQELLQPLSTLDRMLGHMEKEYMAETFQ